MATFNKMTLVPYPGATAKAKELRKEMGEVLRESDSDDEKVKKLRAHDDGLPALLRQDEGTGAWG